MRDSAPLALAAAILGSLAGCGEPPVEWPESSPFPIEDISSAWRSPICASRVRTS